MPLNLQSSTAHLNNGCKAVAMGAVIARKCLKMGYYLQLAGQDRLKRSIPFSLLLMETLMEERQVRDAC